MTGLKRGIAVLFAVIGGIWVGQGLGLIPGSFMTSDLRWAAAGAVMLAVAAALVWSSRRG